MQIVSEKNINMQELDFTEDDDTLKDKFLTFKISNEIYALEIGFVIEIIGMQSITKIPNIKGFINGIINLRGIIIPVIEVRTRFGMPKIPYTDRTCIVVVNINESSIGLIVDEVSEVLMIPSENISAPPATGKGTQSKFIKGVGSIEDDIKILLDIKTLLYDEIIYN